MIGKKVAHESTLKIIDQVGVMLAYWDKDHICRFVNNASHEWFGKSPDELTGSSLKDFMGNAYNKHLPHLKAVLKGKSKTLACTLQLPSGAVRHCIISYYPDKNKNTKGFFSHITDVSLMKNLEGKFRRAASRYKKIIENAPDAIVIVNEAGKIKLINAQCESMFGYTKQELIGRSIEELMPERFRNEHRYQRDIFRLNPNFRAMGEGLKLLALRKNNEEFPVEISLSPLKIKEEMLISASIRDITWKVDKQNELLQSMEVINNQNKRLLNFAHIVSHNLKTHSTNLASVLSLLGEANSEEDRKQMMEFLQSVSAGFSDTVKNLNEVVNIQMEKKLERVKLSLSQYVNKCLETVDLNVKAIGATIQTNIADDVEILHNPAYLESIIQNLITNAIKYRDPSRTLVIKIAGYRKKEEVVLRIEDNGLGINLKRHGERLFGIYQTFHGNADAKGVGLFITKYQIEELGGHINVMSNEGIGSVFTVYFKS